MWGLKMVLDVGAEAAALDEPYADRPGYRGELMWTRAGLEHALATAVRRGWPRGTHAFGDRAVGLLLDVVASLREPFEPLPRGALVLGHGGLIGARVADAVRLGVHVTVQQALLDGLGEALVASFGARRAAELFPLRGLIDAGAWISAGTGHPIGPLDPLRGLHGMVTRRTSAGTLGAHHVIRRDEALRLYTSAGATLLGGGTTGTLAPGAPADLVACPADPLTCEAGQLLDLRPAVTVIDGRVVHRAE
jgi:hypothetical protein